jgi:ADP-heptose:LPS heptosyltransferase
VDEVIALDRDVYRRANLPRMAIATWRLLARLRSAAFTHAIDLHGFGETALLARWTGARDRWGVVYKRSRGYAYTIKVPRMDGLHPIDANLALLKDCGLQARAVENYFQVPDENVVEARNLLATLDIAATDKYVFVQPFTSNPAKDWPLLNYLELAREWRKAGVKTLFGGGPNDGARLDIVFKEGFPSSSGATLLTSAALARKSQLVIGGDTGLLHLAVAMQKRVLLIVNSPHTMTIPYSHPDWAIAPGPGSGIQAIPAATVAEKCRSILFGNSSQPAKLGPE